MLICREELVSLQALETELQEREQRFSNLETNKLRVQNQVKYKAETSQKL